MCPDRPIDEPAVPPEPVQRPVGVPRQSPSPEPVHVSPEARGCRGMAKQVDCYRLYERAVQCPEAEVDFIEQRFLERRGRPARSLAEDFCGTAAVCREWVARHPGNRALGIDNDPGVLAWADRQRRAMLSKAQQARLRLLRADLMEIDTGSTERLVQEPVDLVLAMNFSWWLITERAALRQYFQRVRRRLTADGWLLLDAYGGYDAFRVITEEREIDDGEAPAFTYVWDQTDYDPISGLMQCAIHFQFPDGSRVDNAFCYQWRLWTLPELREILTEAGFKDIRIYWQGWTEDGEPDGDFKPVCRADPDAGWICYLSAEP